MLRFAPFDFARYTSVMPDFRRASAGRKESFQLKGLNWLALG